MCDKNTIRFGLNTCCYTRRWEEVDSWFDISKRTGYPILQFDSDALDPFFSGDIVYQTQVAKAIKEKSQSYGMEIKGYYTGMASYRFHGISHQDQSPREQMRQWIIRAMDLASQMGTDTVGGRFDAYSVETLADPLRYRQRLECGVNLYRELAVIGKEKGMKALELEQMSVPSLVPYQISQAQDYYSRLNCDNHGCKITITVDVGHAAGQKYGNVGEDLSYREWLKHFGAMSECIHIQQTRQGASDHSPFTRAANATGIVRIDEVLEAIRYSDRNWQNEPWSEYVKPESNHVLIVEYIPSTTDPETEILDSLFETSEYLKRFIPSDGLVLA